jgi:hypothetical protein
MDHFSLGGVMVRDTDLKPTLAAYDELVGKWNITHPLHSTKIRGRREEFGWMSDNRPMGDAFLDNLDRFLCSIPVIGVGCVIHRPDYNSRYAHLHKERWKMCRTAYCILLERSVKYCMSQGLSLDIRYEQSGKDADKAIVQYTAQLRDAGMPFNPSTSSGYGALSPADFNTVLCCEKPLKVTKSAPMAQIADLYLWPISKNGYESARPDRGYENLHRNGRIIDAILPYAHIPTMGIKYSCFDFQKEGGQT